MKELKKKNNSLDDQIYQIDKIRRMALEASCHISLLNTKFLSLKTASSILSISPKTLKYNLESAGVQLALIGNEFLIDSEDFNNYLLQKKDEYLKKRNQNNRSNK